MISSTTIEASWLLRTLTCHDLRVMKPHKDRRFVKSFLGFSLSSSKSAITAIYVGFVKDCPSNERLYSMKQAEWETGIGIVIEAGALGPSNRTYRSATKFWMRTP